MNLCIVGTGYVGLVTAACFAEMGNNVHCVDINPAVINKLQEGIIPIYEPGLEQIVVRNRDDGRLNFTTNLAEGLKDALFVFNCVGTPPKDDGSSDLSYVYQVAADIGDLIEDYLIVINKSTVPVGTADEVRRIISGKLQARGMKIDFDVVSNPEFLKEGDAVNDFMKPDRVVVGSDNIRTAKLMEALYAPFARSRDKLITMDIRSAEMTKYAANCMLAAKISFINEIANICEKVGADVNDIRRGIGADHRIGYHFIYPGIGYGGSCFPKDVKALISTAKAQDYNPELLESVDLVNNRQKLRLAGKIVAHFDSQPNLNNKCIAVWGLAFKANTDDIRESPSIAMIETLKAKGFKIRAYDPEAGENARALFENQSGIQIVDDQYETLEGADALAIVTEWNQFRNPDFTKIKKQLKAPVIFDGRNLYSSSLMFDLGYTYFSIGR
ncbi:MAG: UDP-glucose/GDP-mannose dehydrogenase family protein [Desulfobacteraceae bacterium]|nr:UDP-glucose/GDP-mannose dehydrogenase family protein [Desulfobacteraceae bacterium]